MAINLRRVVPGKRFKFDRNFFHRSSRSFSSLDNDKETQPPPLYEYQAPKDDSYKNFQSTQQFIRRYLILFPLAFYCVYQMFLVRKNKFSDTKQYKVISRPFEVHVLGRLISHYAYKKKKSLVYKQDTDEVSIVKKCIEKLITANGLERYLPAVKVFLFHDKNNVFMFMNFDQTLFLTTECLNVAGMNESEIALLISHELSHYLLEHQVGRIMSYVIENHIRPKFFSFDKQGCYDPLKDDFKTRTNLQRYSCFYPQQRVIDKFTERHCDTFALHLWRKAYADQSPKNTIISLFGNTVFPVDSNGVACNRKNFADHLRKMPHLSSEQYGFNQLYTYRREETLLHLAGQPLLESIKKLKLSDQGGK